MSIYFVSKYEVFCSQGTFEWTEIRKIEPGKDTENFELFDHEKKIKLFPIRFVNFLFVFSLENSLVKVGPREAYTKSRKPSILYKDVKIEDCCDQFTSDVRKTLKQDRLLKIFVWILHLQNRENVMEILCDRSILQCC